MLLGLQREYNGGKYHPDVGATALDLAEGIGSLLSKAPDRLFGLKIDRLGSVVQASKYESELRALHERIKNIYE